MEVRIYYEDTDAAGVVYHANYLRYFERARTEFFRERGVLVSGLADAGYIFPVVRMELDFRAPGRHDDLLRIETTPENLGGSSFSMRQLAVRIADGKVLVSALVKLVCVDPDMKVRRIPPVVLRVIGSGVDIPSE
jgi:acyl-CoA thioester hydrolase